MSQLQVWAGIDLGGTNVRIGLVGADGTIHTRLELKTKDFETLEILAQRAEDFFQQNEQEYQLMGIGIGAPSANAADGCLHYSPNLPWKGLEPIQQIFEDLVGVPVRITNDANAAAYGERQYGAAKGMADFAVVTLGTGVGSGIIVNNEIVAGNDGNAGELGHTLLQPNGRQCGCGRRGCLETYSSAGGILQTSKELAADWQGSSTLKEMIAANDPVTAADITHHAQNGDHLAIETLELTAEILGMALANLVTLLGLEAIFLMGGPTQAGELLLSPLRRSFDSNVLFYYKGKIKIELSALPASDAAIQGAAALVSA